MKNYSEKKIYKLMIILCSTLLLIYMFFFNPPKDVRDNVYEKAQINPNKIKNISFSEVSKKMNINYTNINPFSTDPSLEPLSPYISSVDINNDGFQDLYITTFQGSKNLLYINYEGKYFREESEKYKLAFLNAEFKPSVTIWSDFNNDGRIDLFLARYGCHSFYSQKSDFTFEEINKSNKICSKPNGANVLDYDQDGWDDIIIANFEADGITESNLSNGIWLNNTRYDNLTGGKNYLLKNKSGNFSKEKNANFLTRSYSHNAGILDLNQDNYPDIFFSNDYAHDEMFLNKKNGFFNDVTEEYIPKISHGLSGMNTEIYDFDRDGIQEIYISNIYKPPFNRFYNLLWSRKTKTAKFENISLKKRIAKCGFSWGAKFADIENDGDEDLFIMNGRSRSAEVTNYAKGKSMWYERVEVSQIPTFIRPFYKSTRSLNGRYISAFEKKCFFVQDEGKFYDIADELKLNDRDERRSLLIWDFNNDGKMDYATAGPRSDIKIYQNNSKNKGNWIGFDFQNVFGSKINHGLTIEFNLSNNQKIYREIYPANGYRGFSDSRVHIGLGSAQISSPIKIKWPHSKKIVTLNKYQINEYNFIYE